MDFGWGLTSPQLALRRFRPDATPLICRRRLALSSPLGRSMEPSSPGWAGACCLESPPCKLAPSASWWTFPRINARMPISQQVSGCPSLSSERLSLIRTFRIPSGLRSLDTTEDVLIFVCFSRANRMPRVLMRSACIDGRVTACESQSLWRIAPLFDSGCTRDRTTAFSSKVTRVTPSRPS